jgi:hypothetical protein
VCFCSALSLAHEVSDLSGRVKLHDRMRYSGRSASNDRGSFMAYVSTPDGYWPWYMGLRREENWRVVECIGIDIPELEMFARGGAEQLSGADENEES